MEPKKKETMDQLSRDALMARRMGMSYGKYKAMHYERERQQREKMERLVEEAKKRRKEREQEKSNRLGK